MKAITTGAFLVPLTNQSGSPNNTLFILWKNPTDKPLTTYLLGERTQFPVTTVGPQKEIEPPHLFKVIVPAHSNGSCLVIYAKENAQQSGGREFESAISKDVVPNLERVKTKRTSHF